MLLLCCFATIISAEVCVSRCSTFPHLWMVTNWGWKTSNQGQLGANGFMHSWVWISAKYSRPVAAGTSLTHGFVARVATGRPQLPRRRVGQWSGSAPACGLRARGLGGLGFSARALNGGNRREEGLYLLAMAPDVKCLQSNPLPTDRSIRHHQHTPIRSPWPTVAAGQAATLSGPVVNTCSPPGVIKNSRNCLLRHRRRRIACSYRVLLKP